MIIFLARESNFLKPERTPALDAEPQVRAVLLQKSGKGLAELYDLLQISDSLFVCLACIFFAKEHFVSLLFWWYIAMMRRCLRLKPEQICTTSSPRPLHSPSVAYSMPPACLFRRLGPLGDCFPWEHWRSIRGLSAGSFRAVTEQEVQAAIEKDEGKRYNVLYRNCQTWASQFCWLLGAPTFLVILASWLHYHFHSHHSGWAPRRFAQGFVVPADVALAAMASHAGGHF